MSKLAVIGGGSSYTPELLSGLIQHPLPNLSIQLYDPNQDRLTPVVGFCQRMARKQGVDLAIEGASSLEACLQGADFVVVQLRVGGQQERHQDIRMGLDRGLIGQETTGVGGMAKALRTLPVMLEIAQKMEELCPQAWLINFTNPAGLITEGLYRFGRKKVVGLCNVPIEMQMDLSEYFQVDSRDLHLDWVGLNHLGWVREVWVKGENRIEEIVQEMEGGQLSHLPEVEYPEGFLSNLGMIPSSYLSYFYAPDQMMKELLDAPQTRAEVVQEIEQDLFNLYRDPSCDVLPELLKKRGGAWYSRLAVQVLHALNSDQPEILIVNTANQGTIKALPDDASIEVACKVSKAGIEPLDLKPPNEEIMGLMCQVKAYERLTIEAVVERSPRKAYMALMAHPLVPSASEAQWMMNRLEQRNHLFR